MLTKEELPACPVATTVRLIGNKWRLLIIRDLLEGPRRFTELLGSVEGISKKVLADNLKALGEEGLILREAYAEVPPRVVYSLSALGETLRPILDAMQAWGERYRSTP